MNPSAWLNYSIGYRKRHVPLELYSTTRLIYCYDKTDRRGVLHVNSETRVARINKKRTGYYDFISAPKTNQRRNTSLPLIIPSRYNMPIVHEQFSVYNKWLIRCCRNDTYTVNPIKRTVNELVSSSERQHCKEKNIFPSFEVTFQNIVVSRRIGMINRSYYTCPPLVCFTFQGYRLAWRDLLVYIAYAEDGSCTNDIDGRGR